MKRMAAVFSCLAIFCVLGCATFGVKPWAERSPQERASYFQAIYNREYSDTMLMAANPTITSAQRDVVRAKREILIKLWPAIKAYDDIVVRGEIPTILDEDTIMNLLNRLATIGG